MKADLTAVESDSPGKCRECPRPQASPPIAARRGGTLNPPGVAQDGLFEAHRGLANWLVMPLSERLELWTPRDLAADHLATLEEQMLQVVSALVRLPESQREAVAPHRFEVLRFGEIRHRTSRSREAVVSLHKRGLRRLRVELKLPSSGDSPGERAHGRA